MGIIADKLKRLEDDQKRLDEFRKLKIKALSIFDDQFMSLEEIGEIANHEWQQIYHYHGIYIRDSNIKDFFPRLKRANINRKEFKELLKPQIANIEVFYTNLEEQVRKERMEFEKLFDDFLDDNENKESLKYILFTVTQPEAKKLLMKFLES